MVSSFEIFGSSSAAKDISLKLLILKDKNQVVYAESGKELVDVLFSFLTMPVGTIIRLTEKQSQMGCLDNLYGSLEDLDVQFLQSESCKNMLLFPKGASGEHCRNLAVNIDDTESTRNFSRHSAFDPTQGGWKLPREEGKDGVFVKGKMKYMIRDDLQVSPACMEASLELLKRFGISDATVLEEKNVNLGPVEVLHLLKNSLVSKTSLTDVLLPVQHNIDRAALDLKVTAFDSKDMAQSYIEKVICSNSKNMTVTLFVSKSKKKVLYAEVREEFPDMLFGFLAFPIGSIVKWLGGCSSMGCLDNLYKSVEELGNKDCMKSEELKALLLDPKLVPNFGSTDQLIQIKELPMQLTIYNCLSCISGGTYITDGDPGKCLHGRQKIQLEIVNPKFRDVATEVGGAFMDGPATFMVTDELLVKPLSTISCLSLLSQINLPINDLEVQVVGVGEKEALSLLKASLVSKTVLSDVFLKKKKQLDYDYDGFRS